MTAAQKVVLALELTVEEAAILHLEVRRRLDTTEHWLRTEAHRYRPANAVVAALRTESSILKRILLQLEPPADAAR